MEAILKVDNINVYYGSIHAIKGVSFEVAQGEVVTLIGANGAGKSTTLNTISGLLRSKTGSVTFLGEDLGKVPAHKVVSRGLALVPEGRRVFLQMTTQENLEMGAYTRSGKPDPADLEKVYAQFPRLKERRKQVAGTLSGGEQQMLAMGRGHHHSSGGAERPGGAVRGGPGLCAGDRQGGHLRHRRGAAGLSGHQEGLSGRLSRRTVGGPFPLFREWPAFSPAALAAAGNFLNKL